jgi:hypothetical protein
MTTFPESHQDLLKADVAMLATIGPASYRPSQDSRLPVGANGQEQAFKPTSLSIEAHSEHTVPASQF